MNTTTKVIGRKEGSDTHITDHYKITEKKFRLVYEYCCSLGGKTSTMYIYSIHMYYMYVTDGIF